MLEPSSAPNSSKLFGSIAARAVGGDVEAGQILLKEFSSVIAQAAARLKGSVLMSFSYGST